ncbi:MFS transporter [Bacillus mesophilum]|uniref:MFS transporter n=1 Tax=Bacillus mesophilum TaxID=1071718 RepID=A0A7V7RLQ1_9BACI|nr:MFS transporter [Bacillus mesophilum]KAB2331856.1 MFS transporter [Bacillus mesophilum]
MNAAVKKNLILFVSGKMIAVLGSSLYGFAIGLYILAETGSSLNFAITLMLSVLPRILLAPVAGALSDRLDRKKIIIISDFACAIWLTIILLLFHFVFPEIWLLYTATAVLSTLNTFYSTAVTSSIYNMIGPEHLQKAMSLNQAAASLSTILGPVLGGVLFGFMTLPFFMMINIIAFTVSGIASILINYHLFAEKKEENKQTNFFEDMKTGFVYVKNQPFIFNLILVCIWINFWFAVFPVAMPYLVLTVKGMEPFQLGIIEGSLSVGMLIMAIFLSSRPEMKKKENAIIGGMIALSLVLVLLGLPSMPGLNAISNNLVFIYLIIMVLLLSTFVMLINMPVMVLLQKSTPDSYRGRVMSIMEMGATAMTPLGYIIFGALLESVPVWLLFSVCGLSIFLLLCYQLWKRTLIIHLRELDGKPDPVVTAEL